MRAKIAPWGRKILPLAASIAGVIDLVGAKKPYISLAFSAWHGAC
jgi:hypothetical protein